MAALTLRDGKQLVYQDTGSGRPIVFLHGWGMRGAYFDGQVAGLHGRYRAIVPDLRGHGASSEVDVGQGLDVLVGDVNELLEALDLTDVLLVGWSMGAMLSWGLLSGGDAGRITSLATIDMVPRLLNDDQWQFGLRAGCDASVFDSVVERMLHDWPAFTRVFVPRIFAEKRVDQHEQIVARMIRETEKNHPLSMARLWTSMVTQDFRGVMSDIEIPCRVIYGALSQLYSESASTWVANEMKNAQTLRFEASGHAPHLEETAYFNEQLMAFAEVSR